MTKRVLLTGGGSGIGKEMAREFVATGANVCVCGINEAALEAAEKGLLSSLIFPRSALHCAYTSL